MEIRLTVLLGMLLLVTSTACSDQVDVVGAGSTDTRLTTTSSTTVAPTTTTAAPTTTTTAAPTTTTTSIDYVAVGAQLATDLGCRVCHSTDGSAGLGPTWADLAGSTVALVDGSTVTATASYIRESIVAPDAKIVAGFSAGVMQNNYSGLSADELTALVAYISSR
jgi:cytochrome c2